MLHKIIKGIAPVAFIALAAGLAGCDGAKVRIGNHDGVPLAELDTTGEAPTEVVVAGPDHVLLAQGAKLKIDVSGDRDAVDALRFTLDDGALGIMRDSEKRDVKGRAEVRVTMPLPEKIVIAGSGTIETEGLARNAELVIAGSGKASAKNVEADSFEVVVAGSGSLEAAGNVGKLELNIAGAGRADMGALKVGTAEITIAGSGSADFASDGKVEAQIVGSGDVRVTGAATCTVNAVGSGTLTCRPAPASSPQANARQATEKQAGEKAGKSAKRLAKADKSKVKGKRSGPSKA